MKTELPNEDEEWLDTVEHNGRIYTERVKAKFIEKNNQIEELQNQLIHSNNNEAKEEIQELKEKLEEEKKSKEEWFKFNIYATKKELEQQKQEFEKKIDNLIECINGNIKIEEAQKDRQRLNLFKFFKQELEVLKK